MHRILLALLATLFLTGGAAVGAAAQRGPLPSPTPSPRVRRLLRTMSARDKIAQLIVPWFPGTYAAFDDEALDQARRWVDSLHLGGIIISIGSPLDIAAKLNYLQRRSRQPLLVAADLEGGTAIRFNGGTPFPTNMGVGASGREDDAYQMGRITALEGRAVGIHLTFSPVADVNSNPANPIINTRSFGADAHAVARLLAAAVRGIERNGMLATVKHFPGHGDTDTDSHLALPVIRAGWERLDSVELVPFRAAIQGGVSVVMSAHIALPDLEGGAETPATLSPSLFNGILRDSLKFKGMAVTDALDMGAIVSAYGPGEAGVRAFLAGSDLLLMPTDPRAAIDAMMAALALGRVSRPRLDQSVRRMLEIKERLGLFRRRTMNLERIPSVVGKREFREIARGVTQRAMVLVRDSLGAVDTLRARAGPVALVVYGEGASGTAGAGFIAALGRRGHRVSAFRLYSNSGPASFDSARGTLRAQPIAVFAVAVRAVAWKGSIALPDSVAALIEETARERPTVLVSFGSPYLLAQAPSVSALLLAWTSNPLTEDAAAAALSGAEITGRLPIELPPYYPMGHGLTRAAVR